MLGLIVQLIISYLIIKFSEKQNLSVLGFQPSKKRIIDFLLFFFITASFCALGFLLKLYFGKQQWKVNPAVSISLILEGIRWNIVSVLFEELIFRGVLLYILIKKLGLSKAIIISAVAFGIYHWFSLNVIGNPVMMLMVFITTGLMGLLLAYAYGKSASLYIPVAIHFGWNFTQNFIFSQGPIGNGILLTDSSFRTNSYFVFYCVTFLPVTIMFLVNYLLIKKKYSITPYNLSYDQNKT